MRGSEKHLLLAVRNRLRSECGYKEQECEVELDEMAPATVGNIYVAVMPGGAQTGRNQMTSGGVHDLVWSVSVLLVKRIRNVPRDRLRSVFIEKLDALDEDIDKIIEALDWQYAVINAANASMVAEELTGSSEGFTEPLRFTALDNRPRLANPDLFAGAQGRGGSSACGMARTIHFGGARRITYVVRT